MPDIRKERQKNAGPALRHIFRQECALLAGALVKRGCSVLLIILLCQYLSGGQVGRYLFVLSLIEIAAIAIGFGSQTIMVRVVAQGAAPRAAYSAGLGLRFFSGAATFPLLILAAGALHGSSLLLPCAVMGAGALIAAFTELPAAMLLGRKHMAAKSAVDAANGLLGVGFLWIALASGWGLTGAAWAFTLRNAAVYAIMEAAGRRLTGCGPDPRAPGAARALFLEAAPIGAGLLAIALYTRWSALLLPGWISDQAAGWFGGAWRVFELMTFIGTVLARAAFPSIAEAGGAAAGAPLVRRVLGLSLLASIPVTLGGSLLAEWLLPLVLGQEFRPSVPLLRILCAAAPLIFVYEIMVHALYAAGRQKRVLVVMLAGVASSLGLNIFCLGAFGLEGAAWAALANELLLFAAYGVLCPARGRAAPLLGALLAGGTALLLAIAPPGAAGLTIASAGIGAALAAGIVSIRR